MQGVEPNDDGFWHKIFLVAQAVTSVLPAVAKAAGMSLHEFAGDEHG
jgi:hypothetical protein